MAKEKSGKKPLWLIPVAAFVVAVIAVIAAVFIAFGSGNDAADGAVISKADAKPLDEFFSYVTQGSKSTPTRTDKSGSYTPLQKHKKQTIMLYLVGSDLESLSSLATIDLGEFCDADVDTENTNVVVFTGGASYWHNNLITSDSNYILYMDEDGTFSAVGTTPDVLNMGDCDTLSTFLEYSYYTFPADSYDLILWNHGGGPVHGYGVDELANDNLSLYELKTSLVSSPFYGDNKLGWVMFDACLMSTIETAYIFSEHADYLIASEETVPGPGLYYAAFKGITSSAADGPTVAKTVCKASIDYYNSLNNYQLSWQASYTPFSCLDLSKTDKVISAMDDFFTELDRNITDNFSTISSAREQAYTFGSYSNGDKSLDIIDMKSFAGKISSLSPDKAKALTDAIDEMVVWDLDATAHSSPNGVSVYFPFSAPHYFERKSLPIYEKIGFCEGYCNFLKNFLTVMDGGTPEIWEPDPAEDETDVPSTTEVQTPSATEVQTPSATEGTTQPSDDQLPALPSQHSGLSTTINLTDAQNSTVSSATKCVYSVCDDGKGFYLVSETSDVTRGNNQLVADFDTNKYYLSDGVNEAEASLIEVSRTENEVVYEIPIYISNSGARKVKSMLSEGARTSLLIVFNEENPDGKILGFYVYNNTEGKDTLYELEDGMSVLPYSFAIEEFERDEYNNLKTYNDNSTLTFAYPENVLEVNGELTLTKKPYEGEQKMYGSVVITDIYGYRFAASLKKIYGE